MENSKTLETSSSRRDWLKKSSLIGSALLTGSLSHATAPVAKPAAITRRLPIAVSTYSYWPLQGAKYPIKNVIEDAARLGFDGVEILHRSMEEETIAYQNKLKRLAFDNGMALPLLSIHQNFLQPDVAKRKADIEHTFKCINMAVQMGIPCVRMNTGSWGTVKNKRITPTE